MALTSNTIIRQAYVRLGSWAGDSLAINAQYNADIDFEQIVSESFPPQSMWDMLTGVENEIALVVASNQNNELRRILHDTVTVTIAGGSAGGLIPATGTGGGTIIGELGQVRQFATGALTGAELTPTLHVDEIRAIKRAPLLFKSSYLSYALRPPRIYATVSLVVIDVCTFNYAVRAAAIAANGALLFQQLQDCYFYGLMSALRNQDAAYSELSAQYAPMYAQLLQVQNPTRNVVAEGAS